mmetsp:Transcript_32734/g.35275  ORF Transcript_32734/g.35275 Transcript_32734/m.35275 type:complete len:90 (+) Transcript_32734:56-325(+)
MPINSGTILCGYFEKKRSLDGTVVDVSARSLDCVEGADCVDSVQGVDSSNLLVDGVDVSDRSMDCLDGVQGVDSSNRSEDCKDGNDMSN